MLVQKRYNFTSNKEYYTLMFIKDVSTGLQVEAFKTPFTSQHRIGGKVAVSRNFAFTFYKSTRI